MPSFANKSFVLDQLALLFQSASKETSSDYSSVTLVLLGFAALIIALLAFIAVQYLQKKGDDLEEATMRGFPSTVSMLGLDQSYFTPDLVVPDGWECILHLLAKPKRGQPYDVLDSCGGVVL